MGKNSAIDWTDHTWNPWQGCHKVSPGCKNCYMFRDKKRFGQDPGKVIRSANATSHKPLTWKDPARVFVCSWSDFFIKDADQWRDDAWDIIAQCQHLEFLLLTKRPERIIGNLPISGCPSNVRIGVTAENQEQWDKRVHILTSLGMKNFVSVEPMLGPITMSPMDGKMVDWVICGGESGPNVRHMAYVWAEHLKGQCDRFYSIPFFMKQMSGKDKKTRQEIPEHLYKREFPETGR